MKIEPFLTEQFFAEYEFSAEFLLASSDCETISIAQLLQMSGSTLEELGDVTLGYTESQGDPQLRSQIAKKYANVSSDDVVVLNSPVEGIYLSMQTILEPGNEVIALRPAYDALNNMPRHLCGSIVPWNLVPRSDCWELDFDTLESLISQQTRMIVVNFPHNPTGYVPSSSDFERLVRLSRKYKLWLFCDEIYRGLEFGPTIPSAADVYEKAIVLNGLSKTFGLPGLRSGWLVIRDKELRAEIINWKHYTSICAPAPTEFLARKALLIGERLAARSKAIIEQNLKLCEAYFKTVHDQFIWRRPQAGSVAFVELDLAQIGFDSATLFCHHLAQNFGLVLLPGRCLGFEDNYVRFGLGRSKFGDGLQAFAEIIKSF